MVTGKNCLKGFTIQSAKISLQISDTTAVLNSDVIKSLPYIDANIYIKQVTSEFFFIHMKYLDILYKPKAQISITVDPVFASKVGIFFSCFKRNILLSQSHSYTRACMLTHVHTHTYTLHDDDYVFSIELNISLTRSNKFEIFRVLFFNS